MFNPRMNNGFGGGFGGRRGAFSSRYQYQPAAQGYTNAETASSLISKVMGLLAFSFLFAFIGAIVGVAIALPYNATFIVFIGGFIVLIALNFVINKPGINIFLLYLFTFLEGLGLAPLISLYLAANLGNILGEAFLITAVTSFGLAAYSWTTKRDFSGLGSKLFLGLILLLVASLVSIFFHSTFFVFLISVAGVGLSRPICCTMCSALNTWPTPAQCYWPGRLDLHHGVEPVHLHPGNLDHSPGWQSGRR